MLIESHWRYLHFEAIWFILLFTIITPVAVTHHLERAEAGGWRPVKRLYFLKKKKTHGSTSTEIVDTTEYLKSELFRSIYGCCT